MADKWAPAHKLNNRHHDYPAFDLAIPRGTSVRSVTAGRVTGVTRWGGCGVGVIIKGRDGFKYTYCHGARLTTKKRRRVGPGDKIMLSGSSGHSTGPHLHLQIQGPRGHLLCPQPLLLRWARGIQVTPRSTSSRGCAYSPDSRAYRPKRSHAKHKPSRHKASKHSSKGKASKRRNPKNAKPSKPKNAKPKSSKPKNTKQRSGPARSGRSSGRGNGRGRDAKARGQASRSAGRAHKRGNKHADRKGRQDGKGRRKDDGKRRNRRNAKKRSGERHQRRDRNRGRRRPSSRRERARRAKARAAAKARRLRREARLQALEDARRRAELAMEHRVRPVI